MRQHTEDNMDDRSHRAGCAPASVKGTDKSIRRRAIFTLALLLTLAGCGASAKEETVGVMLTGLDQLPDHLSVPDFWVNGVAGQQAGKGGRKVCCVNLPVRWRAGLKVHVRWDVNNWRDKVYSTHETDVPLEGAGAIGDLYVHFLPDGSVRAIAASVGPGFWEPNPEYPGPQPLADIIPRKAPWKQYPAKGDGSDYREVPNAMKDAKP